jgi:hypothetical protein
VRLVFEKFEAIVKARLRIDVDIHRVSPGV